MPQEFIDYLNQNFGAGTFIVIIATLIGFYFHLKSKVDAYKKRIQDDCEEENDADNEREEKEQNLENQLRSISEQVNNISQALVEIKDSNDQLRQETVSQDHAITELKDSVTALSSNVNKLERGMGEMNAKVVLLIDNDKEDTKAFLLAQHEKWTQLHYIDIKVMDICEKKFDSYLEENGNTFVKDIMEDLRALEKRH